MINKVIYIMGVAGSGKTTIGKLLAEKTGYSFYDADSFHPEANVEKMRAGQPLTDEDRWPWLNNMHLFVQQQLKNNSVILACSALKQVYRDMLDEGISECTRWVFLNGNYETIYERIQQRSGHYMPPALLQSQFDTLEIPGNIIEIDICKTPEEIAEEILKKFNAAIDVL